MRALRSALSRTGDVFARVRSQIRPDRPPGWAAAYLRSAIRTRIHFEYAAQSFRLCGSLLSRGNCRSIPRMLARAGLASPAGFDHSELELELKTSSRKDIRTLELDINQLSKRLCSPNTKQRIRVGYSAGTCRLHTGCARFTGPRVYRRHRCCDRRQRMLASNSTKSFR